MLNINELKFDAHGLIPAVVVDAASKKVLTLAYMNREILDISMKEGRSCFWSRSRQELWRKGETSGNVQRIVDITATGTTLRENDLVVVADDVMDCSARFFAGPAAFRSDARIRALGARLRDAVEKG